MGDLKIFAVQTDNPACAKPLAGLRRLGPNGRETV
jgi:hypothetical protein